MASTQAIWGIDVGRCALKAIKLRSGADDKLEIVAFDYVEHEKILSQPDADRHALIAASLEKFLSRNDLSKDQVVVSVPGQHTLARFTKLPPVAPKRIPDIVRYEADQQIPFDMDEVIWDYQTFQQEGLPDIEVGIFAMKREIIREHLLHFEQAGIEPIAVQSGPLAVYNAVHFDDWLSKETTIVLDIGADNTDLVICTPNGLWTRTVPIGGNAFTEALVKSFKLSFSKAESLKRTAATSKYARQIFQAMRPIFADLVQELQRSIGFYSSTHRDASVDRVVGVGNAFLLPGLQKYLQQNLGINVERPEAFKKATRAAEAGSEDALREQILAFFTAYGLALQGLDKTKVTSSLLPTEIAKQVTWRKKRPAFAAAAACLVLAGGLIWFRQVTDMGALNAAAAGPPPSIKDWEQADSIIQGGVPSAASDRVRAMTIYEAGNKLKSELGKLAGQGAAERKETERLIELQRNKGVIDQILRVVHESVPRPEGPLATAANAEEVATAIASGAAQRGQRRQLVIDELEMHFEPNLKDFIWKGTINTPEAENDYESEGGAALPGIRLKLNCRSPNKAGAEFIREAFIEPLVKNGRRPGTGFFIDKTSLIRGKKVEISQGGAAARTSTARGSSSRSATTPDAGGEAATIIPPERLDPVTLEAIDDDWEFEIWASVILTEAPGAGETEGKGETPGREKPEPKESDDG